MVVCQSTSHNNERCETTLNEWWCVSLHHITMRSVRLENVAWDLCWGESSSTKPCVFPCKVPLAGDERYLVCAAGAAALDSVRNRFLHCVLKRVVVHVCVLLCVC